MLSLMQYKFIPPREAKVVPSYEKQSDVVSVPG